MNINTEMRTHSCGELNEENIGAEVSVCGWVHNNRDLGGMTFIDIRDRYGVTQLVFNMEVNKKLCTEARKLGREYVVRALGKVVERSNKNTKIPTGNIEVEVSELEILSSSKTPPFTIEDDTDGGEEIRMQYRYLDLRRRIISKNFQLRNQLAFETRKFLNSNAFLELETPLLIKSTPEGARDFVVPSRLHPGEFYALPQSPQTFKQLFMVAGFDRYYQLAKCFRDEDLRGDRQPEFTQIDCEMSFVSQQDVIRTFGEMMRYLFKAVKGIDLPDFQYMDYQTALETYGTDKPDLRFGMKISKLTKEVQGKGFRVFDDAEIVVGICAENCGTYSRKQLDKLTDFVKRPQIGASGLVYVKSEDGGIIKSSVDKFFSEDDLKRWMISCDGKEGDLLLILAGDKDKTLKAIGELRLEMGNRLNLRNWDKYIPLWVTDFPLLEWEEESERWHAMHHPFTSPKEVDIALLQSDPGKVRANAYDLVINGIEIGGGSIRIHQRAVQEKMFDLLGFSKEEAKKQFGFLMGAFEFGAPPHGGIALGFDRLAAIFGGTDVIRDFIAFPKNNAGRDTMIEAPSTISPEQLKELKLRVDKG